MRAPVRAPLTRERTLTVLRGPPAAGLPPPLGGAVRQGAVRDWAAADEPSRGRLCVSGRGAPFWNHSSLFHPRTFPFTCAGPALTVGPPEHERVSEEHAAAARARDSGLKSRIGLCCSLHAGRSAGHARAGPRGPGRLSRP